MPDQFNFDTIGEKSRITNKSKKSVFFSFIFSIFIGIETISLLENWLNQIYFSIKQVELPYGTLFYGDILSLNLLKILFISVGVFLASFIFSYLNKNSRYFTNFLLGFLTVYIFSLIFIPLIIYISISQNFNWGDIFFSFSPLEVDFYITLIVLQLLSIGAFSRIGQVFGKRVKRFDIKDESQDTLYGIKKLTLFFLTFPLVAYLNIGFTIFFRTIYMTIAEIFSKDFWAKFLSWETLWGSNREELINIIFAPIFGVIIAWLLLSLFIYGLKTIKNREEKYRTCKIIGIFLILPVVALYFFY